MGGAPVLNSGVAQLAVARAMSRAVFAESGLVDRTTKEAVATAVSLANSCWHCAQRHLSVVESLNERRTTTRTDTEFSTAADHRVRQVTAWARTAGRRADSGLPRPFDDRHAPELVGAVVACHYLNRMATVFPVPPAVDSEPALPAGELPADLAWAAGQGHVAEAFAAAAAAVDAAGRRAVPERVREVLLARLAGWRGEPAGDLAGVVSSVPVDDRPAARLALLAAFAPGQVDNAVVDAFRRPLADDAALVELVSWAGFAAARRVGAWLTGGVRHVEHPSSVLAFTSPRHLRRRPGR